MSPFPTLTHDDYTIACICPMGVELAAVEGMLDEIYQSLPSTLDKNSYTFGRMGAHYLVVAVMPETGNNRAASVATQLLNDFRSIRFSLLVGVGGGIPDLANDVDIRLGDVVVSKPSAIFGGVVQFDRGKAHSYNRFERTGMLQKPPDILLSTVQRLEALHERTDSRIPVFLEDMLERFPKMKKRNYIYQGASKDQLFRMEYEHTGGKDCGHCDRKQTLERVPRVDSIPVIHYGTIGSSDTLVRDSVKREILKTDLNILCVEMEAAGLMNDFPCLVIRGICDYADSHKNERWQPYAAATAAGYAKELLSLIPPLNESSRDAKGVASSMPRQQASSIRTRNVGNLINGPVAGDVIAGSKFVGDGCYQDGKIGRWIYE
ncbi:purine and uridine phosphorylase [Aspergillus sclerotiicarbonarius CBS 121057]|uniref:Purine and uridine phosphorylase n=1 Tax=Aspergillus sclerotiicarbonarius (strain CBS 121057 / IBT 28362) TaxID=1448318 RepID=A0A319EEB1_ASPSB|nr:purine and uridine phosphorylase [Aspergillus sclerotiicarbonarius CBS 121057]